MKAAAKLLVLVLTLVSFAVTAEARPGRRPAASGHGRGRAPVVTAYRPTHRPAAYRPTVAHGPVAYRPAVAYAPAPVVVHAGPVVHTGVVAYEPAPRRVVESDYASDAGLAVGVRPSAILLEGQKLALSRLENPALGGLGLFVRGDLSPEFGLELGFDFLVGGEGDFRQRTMPLMLTGIYRFFPEARLNPYALAGVGVHVSQLSYGYGAELHELWEPAAQIGGGVRVRLTGNLELFGDVRALAVYKNLGTETYSDCGYGAPCGAAAPDDRFNVGAQFSAGLAYRF